MTVEIEANFHKDWIWKESPDAMTRRIALLPNAKLLQEMKEFLVKDREEKGKTVVDIEIILDKRKAFINEMMARIYGWSNVVLADANGELYETTKKVSNGMGEMGVRELIEKIDAFFEEDKSDDISAYTVEFLRIRSLCLDRLTWLGMPKDQMKKELL